MMRWIANQMFAMDIWWPEVQSTYYYSNQPFKESYFLTCIMLKPLVLMFYLWSDGSPGRPNASESYSELVQL